MRRVISLLLENEAGALSRVAGLFSARGYNIESLTVAPTDDATLSHMTIVTYGSDLVIEQITKQLNKLIDVVRLIDLTEGAHIEREMLLAKDPWPSQSRPSSLLPAHGCPQPCALYFRLRSARRRLQAAFSALRV